MMGQSNAFDASGIVVLDVYQGLNCIDACFY